MQLSRRERRVFEALLSLATEGSKVPPDPEASRRIFEEILAHGHWETRAGMRVLLFALEWLPFLFAGWRFWVPFSCRSSPSRQAYIDAIQSSRSALRRICFKGLSAPIHLSHYARPDVQRAVGYDARALNAHYRSLAPTEAPAADVTWEHPNR